jgi:acyl carrier protein
MVDFDAARMEILNWLSETIRTPVDQIDLNKPFAEIGVDSLDAVHMVATIESIIRHELPEDVMRRVQCLNDIFDMMRRKLAAA